MFECFVISVISHTSFNYVRLVISRKDFEKIGSNKQVGSRTDKENSYRLRRNPRKFQILFCDLQFGQLRKFQKLRRRAAVQNKMRGNHHHARQQGEKGKHFNHKIHPKNKIIPYLYFSPSIDKPLTENKLIEKTLVKHFFGKFYET